MIAVPARRTILAGVAVSVFAFLVLGAVGALVVGGVVAIVAAGWGPVVTGRVAGLAAAAALAASAAATVLESPLTDPWRATFAADRPLAGVLGAAAGVLALAAIAFELATGRDPAEVQLPALDRTRPASWKPARSGSALSRRVTAAAGVIVLAVGAAVALRARWGPGAIEAAVLQVRANLEGGLGYGRGLASGEMVSPLTPVLLLVTGFGPSLLAAATIAAVAWMGSRVDGRRGGARHGVPVGVVAVLLPSTWAQPLPVLLATGAVGAAAIALGLPEPPTPRRAAVAGALVGGALLSDPTTALAVAVLGGAILRASPRPTPSLAAFAAPVAAVSLLLQLAVARLGVGWSDWWASGGDLADVGWVGWSLDVAVGLAVLHLAVRAGRMVPMVVLLLTAVVLLHLDRGGSSVWGWTTLLLLILPTWGIPPDPDGSLRRATETIPGAQTATGE